MMIDSYRSKTIREKTDTSSIASNLVPHYKDERLKYLNRINANLNNILIKL